MFSQKQIQLIAEVLRKTDTYNFKDPDSGFGLYDYEPCYSKDELTQAFISLFNKTQMYLDGRRITQLDFNAEQFVQATRVKKEGK